MSAKLTFNDIENAELGTSKINIPTDLAGCVSVTTSDPVGTSVTGSLSVNTVTGDLFRSTGPGWVKISSVTTTILVNRYRNLTINSAVTSTDATAPAVGDLVGYNGVGSWSSTGNLNIRRSDGASFGSSNAGVLAGGSAGSVTISTELFNGSSWSISGNINRSKSLMAGAGSQNAGLVAGGQKGGLTQGHSEIELFNGSAWSFSGNLNITRVVSAGFGTQNASLVAGGFTSTGADISISSTELFNGSVWSLSGNLSAAKGYLPGVGGQNAGLIVGGDTSGSGDCISTTELFNGSNWSIGGSSSIARLSGAGCGSQVSAMVVGGQTVSDITNLTELFNGSSWSTSSNLGIARTDGSGFGSQNAGLLTGGITVSNDIVNTDIHSQTIFRKVFAKNMTDSKNVGILSTASSVLIQGTNTSITYPANKYLILNRSMNVAVTNYTNLSSISFQSVLGTAPTMTYNLSTTTNLLTVLPGMVVVITAGGANPIAAANAGTFIISRVISPSSFEIQNSSGVSQNPGTGTASILTTMLATDKIDSRDIIVGKTDNGGLVTIQKPIITGNLIKRFK